MPGLLLCSPGEGNRRARDQRLADGHFLPPQQLRERFAAAGVGSDRDVIVYCGSGVTATHDLLALESAGFARVKLFPGSWSQWSADPQRPVAVGPNP